MTKTFIDTSVFIRFLTRDDPKKFEDCKKFLRFIEEGKIRPYTSNIVFLEIQFVLIKVYDFPKVRVLDDINILLSLRNLTVIEKTNSPEALKLYKKYNIKYADCLISTQISKGIKLVSYDEEFSKIQELSCSTPKDFL